MKRKLLGGCIGIALLATALLSYELWQVHQRRHYNAAVSQERFAEAASFNGDWGLFAAAYANHQDGDYQDARIAYSQLIEADDSALRGAAHFNLANTYLQQAATIDRENDADLALPLIELAKVSYRELLRIDSHQWDAKYNLERALQLLPDARPAPIMDLEGLQNPVRTVISADPEDNLP